MKKRLFSLVLALTVAAGCLVGCGGSKSEKKADATNSSEAGGEKILRVASEDPQVPLDMQLNTYSIIMKITDNVTESLLLTNEKGELEPTLLEEMPTLSDDKLTYSFTLKDGVTFHNDAPLTSNDVKYSLQRMVRKYKMSSLLEKVEGYQAYFDELMRSQVLKLLMINTSIFICQRFIHLSYQHFPHLTAQFILQKHVKRLVITGV